MKKKKALISSILCLSALLAGCGETPSSSQTSVVERPFENVTTFTDFVDIHTDDQKAFVEYADGYENLTADQIRNNYHVDGNNSYSDPKAITISWEHEPLSTLQKYVLELSTDDEFNDVITIEGNKTKKIDIYNVLIGQDYYYRVKALYPEGEPDVSETFEFTTASEGPRNLKIDGMTNCRDLGGRTTVNGGMIKQGLIYRTAALDDNQSGSIITEKGKETMLEVLKVKTEIELRGGASGTGGEARNETSSQLGDSINFQYIPFAYSGGKNLLYRNIEPVRKAFDVLGEEENYPIFFHCRIGTDRTGLIGLLINGLLGVDLQEIYQDYLFSDFGSIGKTSTVGQNNEDSIAGYVQQLKEFPGEKFQNKVYNFLLTIGVPAAKLDTIIDVLTEGAKPTNDASKVNVVSVSNSSMTKTGCTVLTKTDIRSPDSYVRFNNTNQSISYTFSNDKAFNGRIYANVMSRNTSQTLKGTLKVTLDGQELEVLNTSFATTALGFGSQSDYWIPAELVASKAVSACGENQSHTLVIESKGSTELYISQVAMLVM